MSRNPVLYKSLVVGVIALFIGVGVQPAFATVQLETEIDVEPKDYLFQTLIDIANNPDIKELLEQYDNDLFKVYINRGIYHRLLWRNPRLFFNTLFTKSIISTDYLNNCYNKGFEFSYILGKDKVLETIENVEITDSKLFDELNNILTKDEELLGRFETLKEMNKVLNLDWGFPIICLLLTILIIPFILWYGLFNGLSLIFLLNKNIIISKILKAIAYVVFIPLGILVIALTNFQCFGEPYRLNIDMNINRS